MRKLRGSWAALLALTMWSLACFVPNAQGQKRETAQVRTLTGHVFNRQDQPVTKAIVYLKNTKTLAIKTYISEPDGTYHFPALSPNVDYEIYAEFQGARSDTKTLSAFDNRKQVNITLHIK
jgi:Carboxypeptidase regulatory-like domain